MPISTRFSPIVLLSAIYSVHGFELFEFRIIRLLTGVHISGVRLIGKLSGEFSSDVAFCLICVEDVSCTPVFPTSVLAPLVGSVTLSVAWPRGVLEAGAFPLSVHTTGGHLGIPPSILRGECSHVEGSVATSRKKEERKTKRMKRR